jgi:ribosomal protein S18 acetylase RimI-like enzyme
MTAADTRTATTATTAPSSPEPPAQTEVAGLPVDVRARPFDLEGDAEALAAFLAAVNIQDGFNQILTPEELQAEWRETPGFVPARDALVLEDPAGIVAHVNIDAQVRSGKVVHLMEGWVRQDRRHEGIGTALLRWAERHSAWRSRNGASPRPDLPAFIGFGVLESNPAAMAFAASTDYRPIRYGFQMRRSLAEPIPDISLPEGLEMRPVREEDHRRIYDADVEAFRDHWEPRERTEDDFVAMFAFPGLDTSLWRVAWDGDEVAGCVMNAYFPEESARTGEKLGWLEHVSVRRAWRGRGVAKALIVSSMELHRDRGMEYAALGVDAENPTGALSLYEGLGFRPHLKWITHRKPLDPAAILEEGS